MLCKLACKPAKDPAKFLAKFIANFLQDRMFFPTLRCWVCYISSVKSAPSLLLPSFAAIPPAELQGRIFLAVPSSAPNSTAIPLAKLQVAISCRHVRDVCSKPRKLSKRILLKGI